jgi:DNA-binding transcriptional LysR family regulator
MGPVNRLEREFGQPLLDRVDGARIMRTTSLGSTVAASVRAAERRSQRAKH